MKASLLPDGGTALAEKRLQLPAVIALTQVCIEDQLLKEVLPGRTLVCTELFGHMFSFLIPMNPEQLLDHFEHRLLLILSDFRVGQPQQSSLGEKFRNVLCEVKL